MHRINKYLFLLVAVFVIIACSTQKNYKTLTFFFDGVPDPASDTLKLQQDSINTDSLQLLALLTKYTTPENYYHEPYRAKECAACHDQATMGKLVDSQPALCYQCHPDFSDNNKTLHGAVEAGSCTECHNPHQSVENHLLLKSDEALCLNCHDSEVINASQFHKISEETNCISCHNPHGGENKFVLQKDACYKCHDNFKDRYKYLHGPIAGGLCMDCHTSHIEGTGNLNRTGQDLCLHCHDKELVFNNEIHADIENEDCTQCHNPHGGENKFILN